MTVPASVQRETDPGLGYIWLNSSWCTATGSPFLSKMRKRELVVPWSMLPTNTSSGGAIWAVQGATSRCGSSGGAVIGAAAQCLWTTRTHWRKRTELWAAPPSGRCFGACANALVRLRPGLRGRGSRVRWRSGIGTWDLDQLPAFELGPPDHGRRRVQVASDWPRCTWSWTSSTVELGPFWLRSGTVHRGHLLKRLAAVICDHAGSGCCRRGSRRGMLSCVVCCMSCLVRPDVQRWCTAWPWS